MMELYIPSPIQKYFDKLLEHKYIYKNNKIVSCEFRLLENIQNFKSGYLNIFPNESQAPDAKHKYLDALVKKFDYNCHLYESFLKRECDKNCAVLDSLENQGYHTITLELANESRIIVGLGENTPYETGLKLHHIYGYPYIPSSAVKGIARVWLELAEDTFSNKTFEGEELKIKIRKESHTVFGSADKNEKWKKSLNDSEIRESSNYLDSKLGDVLFLDAFPKEFPKLVVDIMNPHYSPYYKEPKNAPGDWYSPSPIFFIAIEKGATFHFSLASRNKESLQKASQWLKSGLSELGIGAKTSSGYGFFLHPDEERKREEEAKKAEEAKRPDWAKEQEQEIKEAILDKLELSDVELIEKDIREGEPYETFKKAYDMWVLLNDDDDEKLRLANLFFSKDKKYMKNRIKNGKYWANALDKYRKNKN